MLATSGSSYFLFDSLTAWQLPNSVEPAVAENQFGFRGYAPAAVRGGGAGVFIARSLHSKGRARNYEKILFVSRTSLFKVDLSLQVSACPGGIRP